MWDEHALQRAEQRSKTVDDVESVIKSPRSTQSEGGSRWRLTGCVRGRVLHVVVAELGSSSVKVVTVYGEARTCR